jgi:hypothetical protein
MVLTKKKAKFNQDIIKGRIAEALVEQLFLSLDYKVFRFGMENTIPGAMKDINSHESEVTKHIRRMPDFVIQDKKGRTYFIEAKFRSKGNFSIRFLKEKDYPYKDCYFVIVSKKHIKCITYKELKEGKKITPKDRKYLGNRKEFELDRDVIIQFCKFATKFFSGV